MVNRLNFYNPAFYAMEALIWLKNRAGMYQRVYRELDTERRAFGKGDVINIRGPARFTAAAAPASAFQDLTTRTRQIQLNRFFEVPFVVTDQQIAYAGDRLINDHIGPAADALAQEMDTYLYGLTAYCPHTKDLNGTVMGDVPTAVAAIRKIMVDNQVPTGAPIHYMASTTTTARLLASSAFTQWQGAGEQGVQAQVTGTLGRRYGFDWFESQNGPVLQADSVASISGTLTTGTGTKNDTTLTLNTSTAQTAVLRKGMVFSVTVAGVAYKYAVRTDTAATGNNWVSVPISPPLRHDVNANTWAFVATSALGSGATYQADLAFHRNAIALAFAQLPMHGSDMGARVFTASDEQTGLSVRARLWYDARNAQVGVVLDQLYGGEMIDPDLAFRGVVN